MPESNPTLPDILAPQAPAPQAPAPQAPAPQAPAPQAPAPQAPRETQREKTHRILEGIFSHNFTSFKNSASQPLALYKEKGYAIEIPSEELKAVLMVEYERFTEKIIEIPLLDCFMTQKAARISINDEEPINTFARSCFDPETKTISIHTYNGSKIINIGNPSQQAKKNTPPPIFSYSQLYQPIKYIENIPYSELPKLFNLMPPLEKMEKVIMLTFILNSFFQPAPLPALLILGPEGSAKTSIATIIASLINPHAMPNNVLNEKTDLVSILSNNPTPRFDNVSFIDQSQSDILCQFITGGGISKRKLYTDNKLYILPLHGTFIMTSITNPIKSPDLIDRCLTINTTRPDEFHDPWNEFIKQKPKLTGALFAALKLALSSLNNLTPDPTARMPITSQLTQLSCIILGYTDMTNTINSQINANKTETAIMNSIVGPELINYLGIHGSIEGTATELRNQFAPKMSPAGFGMALMTMAHTLSKLGFCLSKKQSRLKRTIRIEKTI